jgi:hypothetical protein
VHKGIKTAVFRCAMHACSCVHCGTWQLVVCLLHFMALIFSQCSDCSCGTCESYNEDLVVRVLLVQRSYQMAGAPACRCLLALVCVQRALHTLLFVQPCCLCRLCSWQSAQQQHLTRHSVLSAASSCSVHGITGDQQSANSTGPDVCCLQPAGWRLLF